MAPSAQGLGRVTQGAARSDFELSRRLLHRVWSVSDSRNVKACIGSIYAALERHERSLPKGVLQERPRQWTERRVRAIWCGEARRIDAYEMVDLEIVAQDEAALELTSSIERAARMADFLQSRTRGANHGALKRLHGIFSQRMVRTPAQDSNA